MDQQRLKLRCGRRIAQNTRARVPTRRAQQDESVLHRMSDHLPLPPSWWPNSDICHGCRRRSKHPTTVCFWPLPAHDSKMARYMLETKRPDSSVRVRTSPGPGQLRLAAANAGHPDDCSCGPTTMSVAAATHCGQNGKATGRGHCLDVIAPSTILAVMLAQITASPKAAAVLAMTLAVSTQVRTCPNMMALTPLRSNSTTAKTAPACAELASPPPVVQPVGFG